MTEEELREKIDRVIKLKRYNINILDSEIVAEILALIREAGYEPPDQVRLMVEASYTDGVDDTEQKYKGWKSPEEVEKRIDIILGLGEKKEPQ